MLRLFLAAMHLIALGIGLGSVWTRASALSRPLDRAAMVRAFHADTWWGVAAALWIATGLWRLLAGTEKATTYYTHNHVFFDRFAGATCGTGVATGTATVTSGFRWLSMSVRISRALWYRCAGN